MDTNEHRKIWSTNVRNTTHENVTHSTRTWGVKYTTLENTTQFILE
jgi:hypothetical protein